MSKFEESHPRHEVHELHKPEGHGYVDQKYGKGNLSPIRNSVPSIESGSVPGANGAGSPGVPTDGYGAGASGAM
jgi:hypothetical protein